MDATDETTQTEFLAYNIIGFLFLPRYQKLQLVEISLSVTSMQIIHPIKNM